MMPRFIVYQHCRGRRSSRGARGVVPVGHSHHPPRVVRRTYITDKLARAMVARDAAAESRVREAARSAKRSIVGSSERSTNEDSAPATGPNDAVLSRAEHEVSRSIFWQMWRGAGYAGVLTSVHLL